jgi:hypothetical protein
MAPLDWWWLTGPPAGVAALYGPYLADPRLARVLSSVCPERTPAVFLGDMDPIGVAQYVTARDMLRANDGPMLLYGGINDAWLEAMERGRRRRFPAEALRIPLDKREARLWKRLEAAMDLEELLGPAACRLLRGGYKLELEAASNPAILKPAHKRWVFGYLRSIALPKRRERPPCDLTST